MSNATTTAEALALMIDGMIQTRKDYAAEHGITLTDEQIADSVKASLLRMLANDTEAHEIADAKLAAL